MVKSRRYGDHGPEAAASANASLLCALSVLNRLFAPYLPFATEEVWSWWQSGSVHRAPWPEVDEIDHVSPPDAEARRALDSAIDVLGEIRRVKSTEKRPLKSRIDLAVVRWSEPAIALLKTVEADVRTAGGVERFEYQAGDDRLSMTLTFAQETAAPGEQRA
jgi:valyl-tRNA synthetase